MKEIGGYIEFQKNEGDIFHEHAIALNCGRNCLRYLIQSKKITKIQLPKFLCNSVVNVCKQEQVEISYYSIGWNFLPMETDLADDEWLYIVNYYGQLNNTTISMLKTKYNRVIIDNSQSYFQLPVDKTDTLYTCRKFFGVPDGAFLYTDAYTEIKETDISYKRMNYLLGRFEKGAAEFYPEYVANEKAFEQETMKGMSLLTENILRGLNYDKIQEIRSKNFAYLHTKLEKLNKLDLIIPKGGFMYPLYVEKGADIRTKLQKKKIYISTLWPDVYQLCKENEREYSLAKNILPLPIDQRYHKSTMEYMVDEIMKLI